jgi:hypothetical protein
MKKRFFGVFVAAVFPVSAFGQWYTPYPVNLPYIPSVSNGGLYIPPSNDDQSTEQRTNIESASVANPSDLRFSPNASQRKRNLADFIQAAAKVSPDYAPQLAAELGDGSIFNQYGQLVESIGLDPNNVSDNMAVWWLTAWEASAGRPMEISPSSFAVVRDQVQNMMLNADVAAYSNADKQKLADDFMIRSLVLSSQIDQAKVDPDFAKQLAAGVKQSVKESGLDFDKLSLTEDGFVPRKGRKGADASDVVGGDTALAANGADNASGAESGNRITYGIMAALGLGAAFMIGKGMKKG